MDKQQSKQQSYKIQRMSKHIVHQNDMEIEEPKIFVSIYHYHSGENDRIRTIFEFSETNSYMSNNTSFSC